MYVGFSFIVLLCFFFFCHLTFAGHTFLAFISFLMGRKKKDNVTADINCLSQLFHCKPPHKTNSDPDNEPQTTKSHYYNHPKSSEHFHHLTFTSQVYYHYYTRTHLPISAIFHLCPIIWLIIETKIEPPIFSPPKHQDISTQWCNTVARLSVKWAWSLVIIYHLFLTTNTNLCILSSPAPH